LKRGIAGIVTVFVTVSEGRSRFVRRWYSTARPRVSPDPKESEFRPVEGRGGLNFRFADPPGVLEEQGKEPAMGFLAPNRAAFKTQELRCAKFLLQDRFHYIAGFRKLLEVPPSAGAAAAANALADSILGEVRSHREALV